MNAAAQAHSSAKIRRASLADGDRVYEICLRTADAGGDATALHHDPRLVGHVWAAPYLHHAADHAFVVVDEADVAGGYVLGAVDSRSYEAALERAWWPRLRREYPLVAEGRTARDQEVVELIHAPPTAIEAIVERYPSHLHIDLLPEFQGAGHGRRMIETLLESLASAGSSGVHLGVSSANERAIGFYRAMGLRELGRSRHGVAFGRRL